MSKVQSNPVSTEDAQIMIFKMRPPQIERFFIWTTGWQNWQPLKSYLESDQKIFVSTFTIPKQGEDTVKATFRDVTEITQTQTNLQMLKEDTKAFSNIKLSEETVSRIVEQEHYQQNKQIDADEITWSNVQKPDLDFSRLSKQPLGKRETRHELKIEVILISTKGKSFRSRSKNISLSGSLLEDTIPFDYYGNIFEIVIINSTTKDPYKSRVQLKARTVGDGGLTQRIQYHNMNDQQKNSLQTLLEDYMSQHKKTQSRAG
jgi:hypothetical protein